MKGISVGIGNINQNINMITVYRLETELKNDPNYIKDAQALTLDTSKPLMGLSGKKGLFGSNQWWANIRNGLIPSFNKTGVILQAYIVGQDKVCFNNTIDILLEDGTIESIGIFVNKESDANLFKEGHVATIVYILDELKAQPASNGGINYLDITLEMAVSDKALLNKQA